jgi:hypothetical protein
MLASVIGPTSIVVYRGVGAAPISSEGTVLVGNLSHPPAQMRSFVLVGCLCHQSTEWDTVLAVNRQHR